MVLLILEEQPKIVQAVFAGDAEKFKELLENNNHYMDKEKRTLLHAAAFKGDSQIASILLETGVDVNAKDKKWYTPLHRACAVGSEEVVTILLNYNSDVNARDRMWQTPLHVSAANDAYNCAEQLLNYVPNPNVTDRSGRTALHHAAYNGHTFVAQLLISKGCLVNACDKKDCRPLHCAVQMGHIDTIELLLRCGADIDAKDRNQYTPLHVAASTGNDTVCRLLLSNCADVNVRNAFGNTPLHVACFNGHSSIYQNLIAAGADPEAVNYRGQTPLHIAAASIDGADCLVLLLESDADINRKGADGRTALHLTTLHGRFTRSKMLIDKGAQIDCSDKNGCTPLHIAAQSGHDVLINSLLNVGADPAKKGYEGRTPLHMCCLSGFVECCRKFIQTGVSLNEKDDFGRTPVHCAAYRGSIECLDLLTSHGADFKVIDTFGRLPIHYAAAQCHFQCVFTLVGIGSPVNVKDVLGCTPLHWSAAYDSDTRCVDYLLNHKADPNITDNKGFTALHYAIEAGNIAVINCLLAVTEDRFSKNQCGTAADVLPLHLATAKLEHLNTITAIINKYNCVNIQNNQGYTPLMLAAREGRVETIPLLLRFGAKPDVYDSNLMTAIHYSAKNGHYYCLQFIIDNLKNMEVLDMLDRQHRTALMLAASGKHGGCVSLLVDAGANFHVVDPDNHSALTRALARDHTAMVQTLLINSCDVNLIDINGKSLLHIAAANGNFMSVKMLIYFMKPEIAKEKDHQGFTALHWACNNGFINTIKFILEKKMFETLEDNTYTPVHCAAYKGFADVLQLLEKYHGTEIVNLMDNRERTPLHIVAIQGHCDCAKFLISKGARIDATDDKGRTPLIAAAQYGQSSLVELLLSFNANQYACDNLGNTALHWACYKKNFQTALTILERCEDNRLVNFTNSEKKTPLHLAARNGMVDVTKQLLKKGASILAVDNEGLTPALCCAPNYNVAQCLALILQALPEFLTASGSTTAPDNPLIKSILSFYERLSEFQTQSRNCHQTQTDISIVSDRKHRLLHQRRKISRTFSLPKTDVTRVPCETERIYVNEDFRKETEILETTYLGKKLHKSCADVSLPSRYIENSSGSNIFSRNNRVPLKAKCRQCIQTKKQCIDCCIKSLLRATNGKLDHRTVLRHIINKLIMQSTANELQIKRKFVDDLEVITDQLKSEIASASHKEMILNFSDEKFSMDAILQREVEKIETLSKIAKHNSRLYIGLDSPKVEKALVSSDAIPSSVKSKEQIHSAVTNSIESQEGHAGSVLNIQADVPYRIDNKFEKDNNSDKTNSRQNTGDYDKQSGNIVITNQNEEGSSSSLDILVNTTDPSSESNEIFLKELDDNSDPECDVNDNKAVKDNKRKWNISCTLS